MRGSAALTEPRPSGGGLGVGVAAELGGFAAGGNGSRRLGAGAGVGAGSCAGGKYRSRAASGRLPSGLTGALRISARSKGSSTPAASAEPLRAWRSSRSAADALVAGGGFDDRRTGDGSGSVAYARAARPPARAQTNSNRRGPASWVRRAILWVGIAGRGSRALGNRRVGRTNGAFTHEAGGR